jgi:hypothetical protein
MTNQKLTIISVSLLTLFLIAMFAAFRQQAQDKFPFEQNDIIQKQQKGSNLNDFPVVDFSQSLLTEEDNIERKEKSKYFNKSNGRKIEENKKILEVTEAESWIESLPAIPVDKSDIILVGTINDSRAYLSEDKTNVYSEYTATVEDILYKKETTSSNYNEVISIMREGGRVKFESGHIQTYHLSGQGTPIKGNKYLMFIKELPSQQGAILLTAYKIIKGKIYPIDNVTSHLSLNGASIQVFRERLEAIS